MFRAGSPGSGRKLYQDEVVQELEAAPTRQKSTEATGTAAIRLNFEK